MYKSIIILSILIVTTVIIIKISAYHIEPFQTTVEYIKARNDILNCHLPDCVYKEHQKCKTYCDTLKHDKDNCKYMCKDLLKDKLDYLRYQQKIFGSSYLNFNNYLI